MHSLTTLFVLVPYALTISAFSLPASIPLTANNSTLSSTNLTSKGDNAPVTGMRIQLENHYFEMLNYFPDQTIDQAFYHLTDMIRLAEPQNPDSVLTKPIQMHLPGSWFLARPLEDKPQLPGYRGGLKWDVLLEAVEEVQRVGATMRSEKGIVVYAKIYVGSSLNYHIVGEVIIDNEKPEEWNDGIADNMPDGSDAWKGPRQVGTLQ